jgi:nicotinamide-nucleotide amidase
LKAHLLTIGDEILIGQIVDTNSAWMSVELNLRGIQVTGKSSVGDTRDAIVSGFLDAARHADVVIATGGLGPTKDDITKKTLADLFGSPMSFHPETYARIEGYFAKIGRPTPPAMRDQATLPDRALILPNKVGTAPGLWFERDNTVFISLPGVPFEMQHLMTEEVMPRLLRRFPARPIAHRTLQTACEGESNIAKRIEAFESSLPEHIRLAYLPALGQVRLRLTGIWQGEVTPGAEAALQAELDARKLELEELLPDLVYGHEEDSLELAVGRLLRDQHQQLVTAESCTGGYVAHLLTKVPGASDYFPGAVVTYSYEMKTRLLGVPPETIERHGAVSEETVVAMARGALERLGGDVAVSISGIAGPGGGTPEKPVGLVWIAVADRTRAVTLKQIFGRDRVKNIQLTGTYALNLVRQFLLGMV